MIRDKLDKKSNITTDLAKERNDLFKKLENEKFKTNNEIIDMENHFNMIENEADNKVSQWMSKHNAKEQELENAKIA
jgi:hypothetical protein